VRRPEFARIAKEVAVSAAAVRASRWLRPARRERSTGSCTRCDQREQNHRLTTAIARLAPERSAV